MKINVHTSAGDWSQSVDIEYSSEIETDCIQADKFVSRILGDDSNIEVSSKIEISEGEL